MAGKREVVGVVRRDKLDKGVVVAVERRVRNIAYGKIQRRTSLFMAHDENNRCQGWRSCGDRRSSSAQSTETFCGRPSC